MSKSSLSPPDTSKAVLKIPNLLSGPDCAVEVVLSPSLVLKNVMSVKELKEQIAATFKEQKAHASPTGRPVQWEQVQIVLADSGETLANDHELPTNLLEFPDDVAYFVKTFEAFEDKRALSKALMVICSEDYYLDAQDMFDEDDEQDHFRTPSGFDPEDEERLRDEEILAHVMEQTTAKEIEGRYGPLRIWDCSRVESLALLFTHFPTFNRDISGWDVSGACDFHDMFSNCAKFNQLVDAWDTSKAVNMNAAQDLNSWDLSKVKASGTAFHDSGKVFDDACKSMRPEFVASWPLRLQKKLPKHLQQAAEEAAAGADAKGKKNTKDSEADAPVTGGSAHAEKKAGKAMKSAAASCSGSNAMKKVAVLEKSNKKTSVKIPSALSGPECAVEIDLRTICNTAGSPTITVKDVQQLIANAFRAQKAHVSASGREVQWEQVQLFVDEKEAGQVQNEQGDHQATPPGVQPAAGKCLVHSDAHLLDSSSKFLAEKLSYSVKTFEPFENKRALHKALMVVCSEDYHTELLSPCGSGALHTSEWGTGFGMGEFHISNPDGGASEGWHTPSDYYENADNDDTPKVLAKLNQTREEIEQIYGPLRIWDCSKIADLAFLFMHFHSFNQDISGWDVSGATDFSHIFYTCQLFNQPLESWNTAKATTMSGMFEGCSAFAQDLNKWNVARIKDASEMFTDASSMRPEFVASWPLHLREKLPKHLQQTKKQAAAGAGTSKGKKNTKDGGPVADAKAKKKAGKAMKSAAMKNSSSNAVKKVVVKKGSKKTSRKKTSTTTTSSRTATTMKKIANKKSSGGSGSTKHAKTGVVAKKEQTAAGVMSSKGMKKTKVALVGSAGATGKQGTKTAKTAGNGKIKQPAKKTGGKSKSTSNAGRKGAGQRKKRDSS
ncbi:unnamed protein product [Amoebophrya sp. A120]|nr:unnamed protein product [Amoebophrya sp. A120]|eukprot:GSA120T00023410001.1